MTDAGAPRTCLVLLNYCDLANSRRFIRAFEHSAVIDRIICVDNCSPTGDFEALHGEFDSGRVMVVRSEHNGGYARGNNLGWRLAMQRWPTLEHLLISNPDVIIDDRSLMGLLATLEDHPEVAALAPLIVEDDGRPSQYFAWPQPGYWTVLVSALVTLNVLRLGLRIGVYPPPEVGDPATAVDVLPGACFVIRESAFAAAGGFDEHTFLFCEENILALRLRQQGLHSLIVPRSTAQHQVSSSILRSVGGGHRKFALMAQSYRYYLREYLATPAPLLALYGVIARVGVAERYLMDRVRAVRRRHPLPPPAALPPPATLLPPAASVAGGGSLTHEEDPVGPGQGGAG